MYGATQSPIDLLRYCVRVVEQDPSAVALGSDLSPSEDVNIPDDQRD